MQERKLSILWGQNCSDTECYKILPISPKFANYISVTYSKHKFLDLILKAQSIKTEEAKAAYRLRENLCDAHN